MDPDQPVQSGQDPCCLLTVSLIAIGFESEQHGDGKCTMLVLAQLKCKMQFKAPIKMSMIYEIVVNEDKLELLQ